MENKELLDKLSRKMESEIKKNNKSEIESFKLMGRIVGVLILIVIACCLIISLGYLLAFQRIEILNIMICGA